MSPMDSDIEGSVIWFEPLPFDRPDFGDCCRIGGSCSSVGEVTISCLMVVSGEDMAMSTYKFLIEGIAIVGLTSSIGSSRAIATSFNISFLGVGTRCASFEEARSVACSAAAAVAARFDMPSFSIFFSVGILGSAGGASISLSTVETPTMVPFIGSSASSLSEANGLSPASRATSTYFPSAMKDTNTASPGLGRCFGRFEVL